MRVRGQRSLYTYVDHPPSDRLVRGLVAFPAIASARGPGAGLALSFFSTSPANRSRRYLG